MLVGLSQNVDYLSWLEGRRTEYLGKESSLQRPGGSQMLLTAIHSRVVLVLYPEFQGPLCLSLCFFYIFRDAVVWVWVDCSPRLVHGLEDWLPVWWRCSGRACKRWSLLDTVVHTCNPSTPQHTIPALHRQQSQHSTPNNPSTPQATSGILGTWGQSRLHKQKALPKQTRWNLVEGVCCLIWKGLMKFLWWFQLLPSRTNCYKKNKLSPDSESLMF